MSNKLLNKIIGTEGNYTSMHTSFDFLVERLDGIPSDTNKVTHKVYFQTEKGPIVIGSGWEKTQKETGHKFISFTLDEGDLPKILSFAAFPETDGQGKVIAGEFNIVRERHRRENRAA